MATLNEIKQSVKVARKNGCKQIILLKCTSAYPADLKESNLATIPFLRKKFNCEVGFSDHTLGIGASVAAVSLGATIIERHFTLDKKMYGPDQSGSMEPSELKEIHEFRNDLMRCLKYK